MDGHGVNGSETTPAGIVAERLRVLRYVIDKMEACVPEKGGTPPRNVIGPFAGAHEPMVQDLCELARRWLAPVEPTITDYLSASKSMRVFRATWHGHEESTA